MRPRVAFFAEGIPAPQGSKSLVRTPHGRTLMIEASRRVKPWRDIVAASARLADVPIHDGDVALHIVCRWERPQRHYAANGQVRASSPPRPGYADCDKLARAVCDALAGIAYKNDRQVASLSVERVWARPGDPPGAHVEVIDLSGE